MTYRPFEIARKHVLACSLLSFLLLELPHVARSADGQQLQARWAIAPGERPYFTTSTEQRGMTYNGWSGNVIVVSRRGGISMHALDAATGAEVTSMDVSGVSGGTFALSKVGAADDGVIYAANFGTIGTATPTFNVYRWANEFSTPTLAYGGDPGAGNIQQWGTTFDVRGMDTQTEIIVSSSGGTIAALLTTADGFNFTSQVISTDVMPGEMGIAVAFGAGDTFWAKSVDGPLLHLSFDRTTGTATTLHRYDITNFPGTVGPIAIDYIDGWLGAINVTTPDTANLYSILDLENAPQLLSSTNLPTDNANTLFMGAVDFGPGFLFALDSNNGLVAYNIVPSTDPVPPSFVLQPAARTVFADADVTLVSSASGTAPLSFQWCKDGVDIAAATNTTLIITNAQTGDSGLYSVVITNIAGSVTSLDAQLTVLPPGVMTPLWSIAPGTRSYLTASGNNQRGAAYNPVTRHLLVVNRAGGLSINVLDALTGTNVATVSTAGIEGGTFVLSKIEVGDDGVIYGANFGSYPGTQFTIYRWENEEAMPTIAFRGDPASGAGNQQYGNSFTLRGSGTNTQILAPTQRGVVALFTTQDGMNFNSTLLTNVPSGGAYHGVAFGPGNTFYGRTNGFPLIRMGFDPVTGETTLLNSFDASQFPDSIGPIAVDLARNLLAGISIASPDIINLYDITDANSPPVFLQSVRANDDNANTLFQGAIEFGGGMLFALDTNNGLGAFVLPFLDIARTNNQVVVSWSAALTGFTLQSASDLTSANWTEVAGVTVNGNRNVFTAFPAASQRRFFRLVK